LKTLLNRLVGPKDKLVLTLLVKNEADIIVDNIFFHYAKGVDFIIVSDNGSDDGTLEILKKLESDGLIKLLRREGYQQHHIVNEMGEIAVKDYAATILIHSDADEFWTPTDERSLKRKFQQFNQSAVLVDRKDVLPTPTAKDDEFPQPDMNIIMKHLKSDDVQKASKQQSLFLFELPPKVMFSVREGIKSVGIGNHLLDNADSGQLTNDIIIYHFPFKSVRRFEEKVVAAGQVLDTMKTAKDTFWHWKRWYAQYKKGKLDQEVDLLIPDLSKIKGISYEKFDYQQRVVNCIKQSNRQLASLYDKYAAKKSRPL
jgi:glycosyltransferase involved in cell wall biosynthesis